MKKTKVIVLCLVVVIMLLSLLACQGQTKLATPTGLTVTEDSVLHWQTVDGASSYVVIINGIEQPKVVSTQLDLKNLGLTIGQSYSIQVKAIGDGYMYSNSDFSFAVSYIHNEDSNNEGDSSGGGNSSNTDKPDGIHNVKTEDMGSICVYSVNNKKVEDRITSSYFDGKKNHYLIYMGTVETVPLSTSVAASNRNGKAIITFSSEQVRETALANSIALSLSQSTSVATTFDFGWDVVIDLGVECTTTIEHGMSIERASSITEAVSKSIGTSITYEIDEKDPIGWYRIALYSFCDAYYSIVLSNDEEPVIEKYELILCPREDECYTVLEYLGDGTTSPKKTYDIEEQLIDDPEDFYKQLPKPKNDLVFITNDVVYEQKSTGTQTISDGGYYGYGCPSDKKDILDLSEYRLLFSDKYLFSINVQIDISEKDDGYQEIYLYNTVNEESKSKLDIQKLKEEKGLIAGIVIEHGPGKLDKTAKTYNFTWHISGKDVKETMYLCYDSHGNSGDTWYKSDLKVTINVSSLVVDKLNNDEIVSSSKEITVTDSGDYGINNSREKDKIMLDTKYSTYKTNEYLYVFDVSIKLKEKEDGYQEVYLYNKLVSSGISNVEEACENGLLAGMTFCHGPGATNKDSETYNLTWYVKGSDIERDTLYICYSAFGQGLDSDTWIRESISVSLKVFKVQETENHENARLFYFCD